MKNGIKWSTFLTAPISCALLAGLLLTTSDQAQATTSLQFDRSHNYGSIFHEIRENNGRGRSDWQSGTFLKSFLKNQKFKDHKTEDQSWWAFGEHEKGFMKNKHENAILFGNHLKGLLNHKNGNHYEKHHNDVVPIPASAWLFGSAIGVLGWSRRRKS